MELVTIYKDIYSKKAEDAHHITVDAALARIRNGKSQRQVERIRAAIDKDKQDSMKCLLPSVCFSGKFGAREDAALIQHSGFLVMDFDEVDDIGEFIGSLAGFEYVYAAWLSPRGNGVKALVKIADGKRHREHFAALKDIFTDIDKSGINESRVCYESYDPNMYLNPNAVAFTKIKITEKIEMKETTGDEREIFTKLLKWLTNKNEAFVTGERNSFIFKLASSCCRFGISQQAAEAMILTEFPASNDFTHKEAGKAIASAYKANKGKYGGAVFEKSVLVDKVTRQELKVDDVHYDINEKLRDVIYGSDVKGNALNIYRDGYGKVKGVGIPELDMHFKEKPGEVTCLTGIANFGKSAILKYFKLLRVILFGEKFASFSPEDNPPEEYYHDFVEMYLGCDCTPNNPERPPESVYSAVYDWISSFIFYVYPRELTPTPEYIKEKFLELIIKEGISSAAIDPFNQMMHDYTKGGGRTDQYLETVLGDFTRFAQANGIPLTIVAHPTKMGADPNGDFKCPGINDLNGGAMWGNKMDNILAYHRPFGVSNPDDPLAELHSKKIKRQKIVGKKGSFDFRYIRRTRRFEFNGIDYMQRAIDAKNGTSILPGFKKHSVDEEAPF